LFCIFTICVPIPPSRLVSFINLSPSCFIAFPPLLTLFGFSTFTSFVLFSNFDLFPSISTSVSSHPVSAFISFLLSHSPFLVLRHLSSSIPSLHFPLYCPLNPICFPTLPINTAILLETQYSAATCVITLRLHVSFETSLE
jgi:hypothetical protein